MADVVNLQQGAKYRLGDIGTIDHSSGLDTKRMESISHADQVLHSDHKEKNGDDIEMESDEFNESKSTSIGQSPRYEAFLMTGDKILRLNSKISPNYAKMKQAELPKHIEVLDSSPTLSRGPFADLENANDHFGNQHYRKSKRRQQGQNEPNGYPIPPSQSENGLVSTSAPSSNIVAASIFTTVSNDQRPVTTDESIDNACREPSLITVHGFNSGNYDSKKISANRTATSLDTDIVDQNSGNLQSTDLFPTTVTNVELPSPTSPSYYSEPVSPARYGFGSGDSPNHKRFLQTNRFQVQNNGDSSPSATIRAQQQHHLQCRFDDVLINDSSRYLNGNTLIINVNQQTTSPVIDAPTSVIVTGATSDSDSPTVSVHSTPLKERIQRFEAASRSSSSSTTAKELDAEAAKRLAKRLYLLDGFRKSDVIKHLVKNNEFSNLVATEYLKHFNLAGLRIDAALRRFLHHFTLTGETSERERVISYFSRRYYECNPGVFNFEDEVHTLTCALLLLNTDLHSQTVTKRMSCHDFIENLTQAGYSFPRDLLKALYQSIKSHPIEWARERSESDASTSIVSGQVACDGRFLEIPDPESQVEYKKAWVMRKCVVDEDGKKMPFGRRSWRMFYATLKGMVLYLHKDEHGFKKSSYQTFRNAIRIHHALAITANDYSKKQHVFRLHTAGLAEYLFQTSDVKEMHSWIDSINFVAACFSAPVLPPPVSSRQSFHRPHMPSAPTKLSMRDQCDAHESRIKDLEKMLDQHRYEAPPRIAKPRQLQEYAEKEVFLLYDLRKYMIYAQVLKARLDEQAERGAAWTDLPTSIDMSTSIVSNADELGNENGNVDGRYSAQSGQSDRLSYRAAISGAMETSGPSHRASYETNL